MFRRLTALLTILAVALCAQGRMLAAHPEPESVGASSRRTFGMLEHSRMNARASIMVDCLTADKYIMVERVMYWGSRGAGTDTIGGYSD